MEFRRYFGENGAQLWERQALTRARVVHGDVDFGHEVAQTVTDVAYGLPWRPEWANAIQAMRDRMEASGSGRDLKRGFGGIVDVEFIVQLYQLKYTGRLSQLRATNTWQALTALRDTGYLDLADFSTLYETYTFLRLVESRLRIVHNRSLDELPEEPDDLERLARRLGCEAGNGVSAGQKLLADLEQCTTQTRELFLRLVNKEGSDGA
jgi:[glutamine synthetase] adenylyltransferase / [glutamine synthetase]-adenylyl-L-tyrosine phosphorylase